MFTKVFALAVAGVLLLGARSMAEGGPVDPECAQSCAPTVELPGGGFCVLSGCLSGGGEVFCAYDCFFPLPPLL
jgi:hypothetical protein